MTKTTYTTAIISVWLISMQPAYAYLDPGTGSMILQIILGGVAGIMVAGKVFWHQLLTFFGIRKPSSDPAQPVETENNKKS
ncbi:MAG: hypothetical protein V3V31_09410 [Methylococcales bacterium]